MQECKTRQLPIGAGHCQWGGFTDRNVCNIQGWHFGGTPSSHVRSPACSAPKMHHTVFDVVLVL